MKGIDSIRTEKRCAGPGRAALLLAGALIAFLVLVVAGAVVSFVASHRHSQSRTTSLLSPDEKHLAELVEVPRGMIDRNFDVRLSTPGDVGSRQVIFQSPDEGRRVGTERFLWSADGEYLLLLGKRFYVHDERIRLATGEYPYLLYHLPTKRLWTNASQCRGIPRFGPGELKGIEFGETLEPAPSTEGGPAP